MNTVARLTELPTVSACFVLPPVNELWLRSVALPDRGDASTPAYDNICPLEIPLKYHKKLT